MNGNVVSSNFISGLNQPKGIIIKGDYLYVINSNINSIGKFNLMNGNVVSSNFISGLNQPKGIIIKGDYLYVLNNNKIEKYSLYDGSVVNANFITGLNLPIGFAINEEYIYVSFNNNIGKYSLNDGSIVNANFITLLDYPNGITVKGDYIYIAKSNNNNIGKYSLYDGSVVDENYITGLNNPEFIAIESNKIYISNRFLQTISVSIAIPSIISAYSTIPGELTIEGEGFENITNILINNSLSCSIPTNGSINNTGTKISLTNVPFIYYVTSIIVETASGDQISNLYIPPQIFPTCFPKNTPITTDQEIIQIQKLNPKIHTINNNKIIAISQTISPDKYLICIEKDGLGYNYPNIKTIISKFHKILYKNKLVCAYTLLNEENKRIYKIEYNGEILYNVLLDNYNKMTVNNLTVETLDPESLIGQLYNKNCTIEKKLNIVKEINEYGLKRKWITQNNKF
jgi:hypothetical protein